MISPVSSMSSVSPCFPTHNSFIITFATLKENPAKQPASQTNPKEIPKNPKEIPKNPKEIPKNQKKNQRTQMKSQRTQRKNDQLDYKIKQNISHTSPISPIKSTK